MTWAAERVPPRAAKLAGKHTPTTQKRVAPLDCFRRASSKGMPRHAYGRWALIVEGVIGFITYML